MRDPGQKASFLNAHSLKPSHRWLYFPCIGAILEWLAEPEVKSSIIKPDMISMVDHDSRGSIHDYPVHANHMWDSVYLQVASGVKGFGSGMPIGKPFPLRQPEVVSSINERELALSEGNLAVF